jgi:hypothetical protein
MTDHSPAAAAQHPITPPPELVQQWLTEGHHQDYCSASEHAIAQSARWGADQELEACCQVLYARYDIPNCIDPKMAEDMREWLRAARRPKPPSLKERALDALKRQAVRSVPSLIATEDCDTIRRALEQLDD